MTVPKPGIASPLLWSTLSSLGTQVLGFLTFATLARLLGVSAFGMVAVAALVIDLLLAISNAGINEAVIQRRTLDEEDADTAFWMNLALGAAFCMATILAAPWIALAFGEPRLTPIIRVLAAIFAITPLGAIHTARLTRGLRFRSVAYRNLAASLAGALVGLPLAFAGFGIWALVAQRIAAALALAASAWASLRWLPRLRFRRRSAVEMFGFGAYLGVAGTLNQINIRSAEVISGALVGPAAVAFIRAGSRIVEILNQITYTPFQQIAMPLLTRTSDDREAFRETYLKLSRLSAFLMFPAFLGTLALARDVVVLVFGAGWEPVADAIRIFACAVFASQMNNLIVASLTAAGASRTVLSWTSLQIALGIAAAVAVHGWGWQAMLMTGVARGYLILPYGFHLLRRHTGLRFRHVLHSIRPACSSAILMALVIVWGIDVIDGRIPPLLALLVWIPAGAALYLAAYLAQDREIISQLRALAASRRGRVAPEPTPL